jgi:hypothetical protein
MQPEMMMNIIWLILGGIVLIISAGFFLTLFKFRLRKKVRKVKAQKPAKKPSVEYVRNQALKKIDKCVYDLSHGRADVRESYQNMSTIMRNFVTDITGKDVTTHTLSELQASGDQRLTDLIAKWYAPEFAMKTKADFMGDAEHAKNVVKRWN